MAKQCSRCGRLTDHRNHFAYCVDDVALRWLLCAVRIVWGRVWWLVSLGAATDKDKQP